MNELKINEEINIENIIYEIRGKQVMLDSDLAKLYQCKNGTKDINRSVKNNSLKFPERFSWVLTEEELQNLRLKFCTANISNKSRTYPRVFTEQGVAMLATILHTSVATKVSVGIMDAFANMHKYISNELNSINIINSKLLEHDNKLKIIENTLTKLNEKQKVNTIFFEGQIYDAYSLLMKILKSAKEEIIVIDNYCDESIVDILKELNIKITIYSKYIKKILVQKYNSQYDDIKIIRNHAFHDRFIILDRKILYHCGASFKDLGKKCFAINLIEDKKLIYDIIKEVSK